MLNLLKKKHCPDDISGFKNMYLGKRCFIIGNGPSLKATDLDRLKKEICFGVNRIYLMFDHTKWRPDFYVVQDQNLLKNYTKEMAEIDIPIKFFASKDAEIINKYEIKGCCYYYNYVRRLYDGSKALFSEDASIQTYEGGTVTYLCMQLAYYMGFNEIYLLGNDFSYSVTKKDDGSLISQNVKDYFCDNYISAGENRFFPRLDLCEEGFKQAKVFLEGKSVKVYNATRGGKLEVFDRVQFDKIVK